MKSWTVICCVGSVFHGRTAQKASQCTLRSVLTFRSTIRDYRRDGRVAEGARLESVFTRKGNVGSNPTLSASFSTTFLGTRMLLCLWSRLQFLDAPRGLFWGCVGPSSCQR